MRVCRRSESAVGHTRLLARSEGRSTSGGAVHSRPPAAPAPPAPRPLSAAFGGRPHCAVPVTAVPDTATASEHQHCRIRLHWPATTTLDTARYTPQRTRASRMKLENDFNPSHLNEIEIILLLKGSESLSAAHLKYFQASPRGVFGILMMGLPKWQTTTTTSVRPDPNTPQERSD